MIFAAIVAGGTGSRMGADIPKQFLKVGGKPIIVRTISSFLNNKRINSVYIGVHREWTDRLYDMCLKDGLDMGRINVTEGGTDRNSTVFKIIGAIRHDCGDSDEDIILTHDGVRPFISQRIIDENIEAMKRFDGVTTCLPSTDTMLYSDDGSTISQVPDRSKMYRAQTPQTFRLSRLISAYDSLSEDKKTKLTDTASVFTSAGLPVGIVMGEETNIKITTPFDMKLSEMIAADFYK